MSVYFFNISDSFSEFNVFLLVLIVPSVPSPNKTFSSYWLSQFMLSLRVILISTLVKITLLPLFSVERHPTLPYPSLTTITHIW